MRILWSYERRNRAALFAAIFVMFMMSIACQSANDVDGEPAGPTTAQPTSPLTLTLSAPEICETKRAQGFARQGCSLDDDGVLRPNGPFWASVGEVPVRWQVSGGTGPYTLIIDNEARDGRGPYEGATGRASVSCAPVPGDVFYNDYDQERWYRADPEVDSGPKTIRASVTDANGSVAQASIEVYIVLQLEGSGETRTGEWRNHRLNAGKTYRFNGHLYTVPDDMTLVAGGGSESIWSLRVEGADALLHVKAGNGEEVNRRLGSLVVWPGQDPYSGNHTHYIGSDDPELSLLLDTEELLINELLDEVIASLGEPPAVREAMR